MSLSDGEEGKPLKREGTNALGLYTVGIAALFLAGFFLLVVFGAQSYRNTVAGQNDNGDTRALLAYLAAAVKGCDSAGAVHIVEEENGQILVLDDGESGYALRIYRVGNTLVEDYGAADSALHPDQAQVLGETGVFAIETPAAGLLRITTDAGSVLLHLRSGGAA